MPSPAERYAAARRRAGEARTQLHAFRARYPFALDPFQERACAALEEGRGVLVAAPTGAGKTVVGEFAAHLALARGRRCFYTTPIKALSNQKYHDLAAAHGPAAVGLLTGDDAVNGDAPVVVMTTEVLRNMLYARPGGLDALDAVVLDEVHYLADRSRGAVWEEVIIHLPAHVAVVALSATVSNAEEFGDWLAAVRGDTAVVVEEHRPVPLWQHVLAGSRLMDLFVDDGRTVSPELVRLSRDAQRAARDARGARRRGPRRPGRAAPSAAGAGRDGPRLRPPGRVEVLARLAASDLLPAITFVFSRAGCDAAAAACLAAGLRLTDAAERDRIAAVVDRRCAALPAADLAALGYADWRAGLERGVAAHHAGLVPLFKQVVEELFQAGLVKAVFATETLALGINMPARAVVLERLVKWDGQAHVEVTPGEYTQLTGRAGRRGIDAEGHAVVLWHPGLDPRALAGLASTRTYPLRSSFRPSYNMAVNLVAATGRARARDVLETSFAQFQADRAVVDLAARARRAEAEAARAAGQMACHQGDYPGYAALLHELAGAERAAARTGGTAARARTAESLRRLVPGDVIEVPAGRRAGPAVVLDPGVRPGAEPAPTVLTTDRQVRRLSVLDFPDAVAPVARVRVPRRFDARSATARRDLAAALRTAAASRRAPRPGRPEGGGDGAARLGDLRARVRRHPCHGCADADEHARWAQRHYRALAEARRYSAQVAGRTRTVARQFDRVCAVLAELGYLDGGGDGAAVTDDGRLLARLYTENDLLTAQCLRAGAWDGLDAAGLAAACAAVVYESRGPETPAPPAPPAPGVGRALDATARLHADLADLEARHDLAFVRAPDAALAPAVYRWANGAPLAGVLAGSDLTAGDFVRWCKQVVDLLDQVAGARPGTQVAAAARAAVAAVSRGVVAYSPLR